jgi:hypothetical protein
MAVHTTKLPRLCFNYFALNVIRKSKYVSFLFHLHSVTGILWRLHYNAQQTITQHALQSRRAVQWEHDIIVATGVVVRPISRLKEQKVNIMCRYKDYFGHKEFQHQKHRRLKLGGGKAYDLSIV